MSSFSSDSSLRLPQRRGDPQHNSRYYSLHTCSLRTLADTHEWNLTYNASTPVHTIADARLAAQILQALDETVTALGSSPKLNIQFGAYASFSGSLYYEKPVQISWISQTTPPSRPSSFPITPPPSPPLHPTSAFASYGTMALCPSVPAVYPLFGQSNKVLLWSTFISKMDQVVIGIRRIGVKPGGIRLGSALPPLPPLPLHPGE